MDRVLLVTKNMPPTVGGMERLNWHMAEELSKVAEVHVIGPRGFASFAPEGVICHEVSSASLLLLMAGMLFRAAVLSRARFSFLIHVEALNIFGKFYDNQT